MALSLWSAEPRFLLAQALSLFFLLLLELLMLLSLLSLLVQLSLLLFVL